MPFFSAKTREATVRILPISSSADAANRLKRLEVGQCSNLCLAGVRHWDLGELCAVIEAAANLAPQITALEMGNMGHDATFLSFDLELISRCTRLRRLDLEGNYFGGGDYNLIEGGSAEEATGVTIARELGLALKDKKELSYVNLTSCGLTDAAALAFITALTSGGGDRRQITATTFVNGITLHLSHNELTSAFAESAGPYFPVDSPKSHPFNGIMLYGNFVSHEAASPLNKACGRRRDMLQEASRHAAASNKKGQQGALSPNSRTSLGLLIECAEESDRGAFPTINSLAKMLEEDGM